MEIKNIAELGKIADICRKKGIESIKITQDAVEFVLKEQPVKTRARRKGKEEKPSTDNIPIENLPTEEELLFWSSHNPEVGAA